MRGARRRAHAAGAVGEPPANAWLAAAGAGDPPMLFQRTTGADHEQLWLERRPASWLLGDGAAPLGGENGRPVGAGPLLTASGQGVWVDFSLSAGTVSGSGTVFVSPASGGEVAGTWCYPTSLCPGDASLGATLPGDYGSFAWPAAGNGDGPGARIVSGLNGGALLSLGAGQSSFAYAVGGGAGGADGAIGPGGVTLGELPGSGSAPTGGAAFSSPEAGWLGAGSAPSAIHVTAGPGGDSLHAWPVPFRKPLLAIAPQPGAVPAEGGAQALAVGAGGEVARYLPGEGWTPEYLYNTNGERQTPNLRGVAWPEAGRAYAVGDNGAMWLWQAQTGQWETDPGKSLGLDTQLTAIAFSAANPELGYAVGKQGTLLAFGKSWEQEPTCEPGVTQHCRPRNWLRRTSPRSRSRAKRRSRPIGCSTPATPPATWRPGDRRAGRQRRLRLARSTPRRRRC